jgi:lipopolysaccharide biosynthesis glycosyltransferase
MSHYNLWKTLAQDNKSNSYLILEDDAVFKDGTLKFWNEVFCKHMPKDFSIIYLGGCQPWNKPHYHKVLSRYNDYFCNVKTNDYFTIGDNFWHMNASSYILSKQAACLLCQWVEQNGMDEALDNFMQKFFNQNKLFSASESIYHLNPLIAHQLHEEGDNCEIDKNSDIRYAEDKFDDIVDYIDVCFCCDENLIEYAINPINAICHANKNNNVRINFIYSGDKKDLKSIKNFLNDKDNILFREYLVKEINIDVQPSWRQISHLSSATNLKLQIPEIIKDVDRVVYFDVDTIPNIDLKEIYDVDISGSGIAMRGEVKNGWRTFNGSKGSVTENKNPIDFGERVIGNSGVMVLDLKRLRKENFTEFCLKEKQENNYNIPLTGGDQDLINIFCECQYDPLPLKFNILIGEEQFLIKDHVAYLQEKELIIDQNGVHWHRSKCVHQFDSYVLHFIGEDKPWNSECDAKDQWEKFDLKKQILKKIVFTQKLLFEQDFIIELIGDEDIIYDEDMSGTYDDCLIVYSDIISKDLDIYKNDSFRKKLALKQKKLKEFLSKQKNCRLVHLSDEHRFADIEHYKNFKHVFRQYYRSDAVADNVTFIPLGYKVGFYDE